MIKEQDVARLDQRRLYRIYTEWPQYFREALKLPNAKYLLHPSDYESLVLCGMGGSGTSCDVLQELMSKHGSIPVIILRTQEMSSFVNSKSLVIVNSVSGNTQESLMMMRDALKKGAEIITISSGGKLQEESVESGCQHIRIPNLSLPRASLPYLLVPSLRIIEPFLDIPITAQVNSLPMKIEYILRDIRIEVPETSNIAKQIAQYLGSGFPFCYSSPSLLPAATRFKNSMNENAKMHCIRESILEASHNEIVPFTFDHSLQASSVLHLRWSEDPAIVSERFDKVHSLFEKVVQPVMEFSVKENELITALVSAIFILDLSTIYIAIAKNTDPSPTPAIQILKDT